MAAASLAQHVGVAPACRALGVSRATLYRRHRPAPGRQQPRKTPARALDESEREHVLDVLASARFVDRSPAEFVATLLDEGQYLCSERTMYRILAARQPVRERRNQLTHPHYTNPELVATAPNQTWSWDITRLLGPKRWTYFYLYVVLDIFSRYVVGWMLAERENAALASRLIEQSCLKHGIGPQVLRPASVLGRSPGRGVKSGIRLRVSIPRPQHGRAPIPRRGRETAREYALTGATEGPMGQQTWWAQRLITMGAGSTVRSRRRRLLRSKTGAQT